MLEIFKKRPKFSIVTLAVFVIAFLVIAIYIVFNSQASSPEAAEVKIKNEKKFVAGQLLIKVNDSNLGRIKKEISRPDDTGVDEINKLNKNLKAKKVEKVFKSGPSNKELDKWYLINFASKGDAVTGEFEVADAGVEGIANLTMADLINVYKELPSIEKAEPNLIFEVGAIPNDTYYSTRNLYSNRDDLWGLKKIGAEEAWDKTTGDNVVVAVVDTGVDYTHPDLAPNIYRDSSNKIIGYDFANRKNDPMDDHMHGTHVAGTIAAVGNNDTNPKTDSGTRVVGVGWNIKIMPIKAFGSNGSANGFDVVEGLKFAADNGAKVINNSWGSASETDFFADINKYIYDKNVVNVYAAGNSRKNVNLSAPGGDPNAITVAATNYLDKIAGFSNFGSDIDFGAPGGDTASSGGVDDFILSTRLKDSTYIGGTLGTHYAIARGTSMAAPHASGSAALVISANPNYSVEEIRSALRISADKVEGVDFTDKLAHGRINVAEAIKLPSVPVARLGFSEGKVRPNADGQVLVDANISARAGVKSWTLYYGPTNSDSYRLIASGANSVNGRIGTINTADDASGNYRIKLTVTDSNNIVANSYKDVMVDAELMPGWPRVGGVVNYSNPVIADINGTGKNYIIYPAGSRINAVDIQQRPLSGFPISAFQPTGSYGVQSQFITVDDLNGNGKQEIVVVRHYLQEVGNPCGTSVSVYNSTGNMLPGWPITLKQGTKNSPYISEASTGDLSGDGKKEVLVYDYNHGFLHAFTLDGKNLTGWPVKTSIVGDEPNDRVPAPALSDVTGNGRPEVFVGSQTGTAYGFTADGKNLTGWPQKVDSHPIKATIGIEDINGDGQKNIIIKSNVHNYSNNALGGGPQNLFAYTSDGKRLWVKNYNFPYNAVFGGKTGPAFVDFLTTGGKEMVQAMDGLEMHAYRGDGSFAPGWPSKIMSSNSSSPALADITGDGTPEIVQSFNNKYANLGIWSLDGKLIDYKEYQDLPTLSSAVVADLDGDSNPEVVLINRIGVYVWKYKNGKTEQNEIVWGQPMKDAQRTAVYGGTVEPPKPDTESPVTSITSPVSGATVSGVVTIKASATDNVGVAKAELYENDSLVATRSVAPYEFSWDTRTLVNGSYKLKTRAYDYAGNVGNSAEITVTVNNVTTPRDTEAPTIIVNSPADGGTVNRKSKVTISVSATDNVGVTRVEIWINGKRVANLSGSPYQYSWKVPAGRNVTVHQIQARGYDAAGNIG
ncbi:S8 family serine peptidase, partial [Patescibacteria group bacterium]|nr:S8 family serine peptidase [Patescibacteria group bacterium]